MARHRRARHGPSHRLVITAGIVVGLLIGGGLVAAAAIPLPSGPPVLTLNVPSAPPAGDPVRLPFPTEGESAVAVPTLGVVLTPGDQSAVPIASLTKMMTAYVTLRALPLSTTQTGPTVFVTSADVAEYKHDLKTDQSTIMVVAGEALTERQLLDGLLVHSANNFATLLARLVAGSTDAMVGEMNADATALGLATTTYVDVSGLNPASRSSAKDQLALAVLLMQNPTFAAVVRQTSVVLPVAGTVTTYTPYLGRPGVVGIKTGTTSEAGGCFLMAYDERVAGRTVQVIAAVLGQHEPNASLLVAAGHAALVLASATAKHLVAWKVTLADVPAGTIGWPARAVPVTATATIIVPTFPGVSASSSVTVEHWSSNVLAFRQPVATVLVRSGSYRAASSIVTAAALTRPSLLQRLR